jgi:hypothetical protein
MSAELRTIKMVERARAEVEFQLSQGKSVALDDWGRFVDRLEGQLSKQIEFWQTWTGMSNKSARDHASGRILAIQTVLEDRYEWQDEPGGV